MKISELIAALSKIIEVELAKDLVNEFLQIKSDCKTGILGRSSCGKFVETVVQVLQFLENGKYDKKPNVDNYLRTLESRVTLLTDDLKICCARIARSCYALRNKRNIAHKGLVDANIYDLRYNYAGAQWILSEIVRQAMTSDMSKAGRIIEFIQTPVVSLVEDFGGRKIVYGNLTVGEELLVLLFSEYPAFVPQKDIIKSMDRRSRSSVYNSLRKHWDKKLIHKDIEGYKLTQEGYNTVLDILKNLPDNL